MRFAPIGADVVVGSVVVVPGAPTPPLWAKAAGEPRTAIASASAAMNCTRLGGVRPTILSINALRTLYAAYGVSCRARA